MDLFPDHYGSDGSGEVGSCPDSQQQSIHNAHLNSQSQNLDFSDNALSTYDFSGEILSPETYNQSHTTAQCNPYFELENSRQMNGFLAPQNYQQDSMTNNPSTYTANGLSPYRPSAPVVGPSLNFSQPHVYREKIKVSPQLVFEYVYDRAPDSNMIFSPDPSTFAAHAPHFFAHAASYNPFQDTHLVDYPQPNIQPMMSQFHDSNQNAVFYAPPVMQDEMVRDYPQEYTSTQEEPATSSAVGVRASVKRGFEGLDSPDITLMCSRTKRSRKSNPRQSFMQTTRNCIHCKHSRRRCKDQLRDVNIRCTRCQEFYNAHFIHGDSLSDVLSADGTHFFHGSLKNSLERLCVAFALQPATRISAASATPIICHLEYLAPTAIPDQLSPHSHPIVFSSKTTTDCGNGLELELLRLDTEQVKTFLLQAVHDILDAKYRPIVARELAIRLSHKDQPRELVPPISSGIVSIAIQCAFGLKMLLNCRREVFHHTSNVTFHERKYFALCAIHSIMLIIADLFELFEGEVENSLTAVKDVEKTSSAIFILYRYANASRKVFEATAENEALNGFFQALKLGTENMMSRLRTFKEVHGAMFCTRTEESEELYNSLIDFKSDAWFSWTFEKHVLPILPQTEHAVSSGKSLDGFLMSRNISEDEAANLEAFRMDPLLQELVELSKTYSSGTSSLSQYSTASDEKLALLDTMNSPLMEKVGKSYAIASQENNSDPAIDHQSNYLLDSPSQDRTQFLLETDGSSLSLPNVPTLTDGDSGADSVRQPEDNTTCGKDGDVKMEKSTEMEATSFPTDRFIWKEWWKVNPAHGVNAAQATSTSRCASDGTDQKRLDLKAPIEILVQDTD